jgi:hypothetical protein
MAVPGEKMGILFVILGTAAIAAGVFVKDFYVADILSGVGFKQKRSRWSGRLIFIVGGLSFVAAGIKVLMGGE